MDWLRSSVIGVHPWVVLSLPSTDVLPLERHGQVISTVLAHWARGKAPLTLTAPTKIKAEYWGSAPEEKTVLVYRGELLQGTLDKATYGTHGLVHAVQVSMLLPAAVLLMMTQNILCLLVMLSCCSFPLSPAQGT